MSIAFNQISARRRVPGVTTEIDNSRAISGAQALRYRVLLPGPKLASGTAATLVAVPVTDKDAAREAFGPGSVLALMVEAALAPESAIDLWALPLDDLPAATAAHGSLAVSGAPTAGGTLALYVGGVPVRASVTTVDTPEVIATALADAITAKTALPVTAAVDIATPATVTVTAKNAGEVGNDIDLRLSYFGEAPVPGLSVAITPLAGGAGNADLGAVIAALGDEWFQVWGLPYSDPANLTLVEDELASRFTPSREIEGHAFVAARGTLGVLGALGHSRNSPHLSIVAAADEPMPPFAKAAETAAIAAFHASVDPARPLQTLPYAYCLPPVELYRFTTQERDLLLFDGIATTTVDDGGVMRTERLVTTYKTNAAGGPDESYLDVETLFTLMTIRHDWKAYLQRKYPRHKLADDGTRFGPGQVVMTPGLMKAEAIVKFREWESNGWVENFDQFKVDLVVERSADRSRLDVLLPPDLINGLRLVANQIQFRL